MLAWALYSYLTVQGSLWHGRLQQLQICLRKQGVLWAS